MANEVDNTDADTSIPEVWRSGFLRGRYSKEVAGPRVLRADKEVANFGDIVHIKTEATISLSSITATTGALVSNSNVTATEVQLALDQWYGATIDVVDKAQRQSFEELSVLLARPAGEAAGQHTDAAIFNEHSNITTNSEGGATATMSGDLLLAAISDLDQSDVPTDNPNEISFFLDYAEKKFLKNLDKMNDYDRTGDMSTTFARRPVGMVSGVPVFFSNQIKTASSQRKNLLLHRECIAFAMQTGPGSFERFARAQWSTKYGFNILYGIKTNREGHGVVISTDSNT